jgi:methylated-DNA-protein-cysteine methyltransferase-like protein
VRRIPAGKVLTYGQVAALIGKPRSGRAVGTALGVLRAPTIDLVPWHRVINASGRCSHRDDFWADIQREFLEAEGVRFDRQGRVDLERARWRGAARKPRRRGG